MEVFNMKYKEKSDPPAVERHAYPIVAGDARQWEIAAKVLAEIAARATSQTSVNKTRIRSEAWH
jgi:hypothetical protein